MITMFRQAPFRISPAPRYLLVCVLALAIALSACSRRQTEWEMARAADTVESYERFLQSFPEGEFSSQAQARAKELREARDWKKAVSANTLGAYQNFVAQYPDGRMSDEARIRIESFTLASGLPANAEISTPGPAPISAAPPAGAVATAPAPAAAPPRQAPATQAASAAPRESGGGGYRIQVGALSGGDKQAMGEWSRMQGEYPKLLDGLTPSVKFATTTSGHLYRLQAGATNEARARDICAKLQADGQACVVVLP